MKFFGDDLGLSGGSGSSSGPPGSSSRGFPLADGPIERPAPPGASTVLYYSPAGMPVLIAPLPPAAAPAPDALGRPPAAAAARPLSSCDGRESASASAFITPGQATAPVLRAPADAPRVVVPWWVYLLGAIALLLLLRD